LRVASNFEASDFGGEKTSLNAFVNQSFSSTATSTVMSTLFLKKLIISRKKFKRNYYKESEFIIFENIQKEGNKMKVILACLVILMVVITGCSSSTPSDQTTKTDSPTVKEAVKETPQTAVTPTTSSANAKLKTILGQKIQYKATYDVKAAGTSSLMTQYMSGDKIRIDVTASGMEIQTFLINKEFTTCNKATGSWMCQKVDYTPSATDKAQEDVKANVESYDVQSTGTKEVAGVTTDCYKITTKDGSVDYCYSADYVPLYVKTTAGAASSELIAQSYTKSVSDQDFVLPAQPGAAINPADYAKNLPKMG